MSRESLVELLAYFRRFGSDTACARRVDYRMVRWSYAAVLATASRIARELEARAVAKGDRVLLWGENCPEWVAAFWGCALRGAVVVPMDRMAAPDFARRVGDQVQAKLAIGSRQQLEQLSGITALVFESFAEALPRRSAAEYRSPELRRSDALQIIFTSGTTAEPKGVVITHGNVLANIEPIEGEIERYRKWERIFHPLRFLNLLPLSHVFGQFMGLFVPPLIGALVIFQDSLNPAEIIQTIKRERVSALIAVPRLLESLRDKLERDFAASGQLERVRAEMERASEETFLKRWWRFRGVHRIFGQKFWALISGGAALPRDTEEFWRRLGYAVVQGYGLTETTSLISAAHPFKLSRGSIGKVLPGREIKLDPETGEILVRGESVTSGYWQGGEMKPVPGEEGWLRTGDIGTLDADGNLYFKGRKKEVIVTPEGFNVYPEDLEAALRRQPEVRDVVVMGLEREGNAVPCAVLLVRAAGDPDVAVHRANKSLAEYQHIRHWFVWPDEDFPRTSTHKPRMNAIAEFVRTQTGAAVPPEAAGGSTLARLIERVTQRQVGALSPDANLATDLNLSSIERVELMSALEDRYQVDLNEARFSEAGTIGDLERMIRTASGGMAGDAAPAPARRSAGLPLQTKREEVGDELARTPAATAPIAKFHYPRWTQRWPVTWIRVAIYYLLSWPATMLLAMPRVVGRDKLRGLRGPVLVISNHITYLDAGLVLYALPVRLRHRLAVAMAAEMLQEIRYPPAAMNWFLRSVSKTVYWLMTALFNVFPLPQRAGFRKSFEFAGESADRGYSALVFPEGARTQDGRLAEFRNGIGILAKGLRLPVVPVRIDGLWEIKRTRRRGSAPWRTITIRIGAPVKIDPAAETEEVTRELERSVREL